MLTMTCVNCKHVDKCENEKFIKLAGLKFGEVCCPEHEFQIKFEETGQKTIDYCENAPEDCVHYNVCKKHKCLECKIVGVSECEEFKESALNFQLPCRFGEQLYLIRTAVNSDKKRLGKATVLNYRNLGYVIKNFNKTIFTRDVAEKEVRRLND